jgi:hypothetical protein
VTTRKTTLIAVNIGANNPPENEYNVPSLTLPSRVDVNLGLSHPLLFGSTTCLEIGKSPIAIFAYAYGDFMYVPRT